jgi:hypothetical protein
MGFWLAGLILLPKINENPSFRSSNSQKFPAARGKNLQMVISELAKASWFAADRKLVRAAGWLRKHKHQSSLGQAAVGRGGERVAR